MKDFTPITRIIDHSLLHPSMNNQDIIKGCETAKNYHVASVCVKPYAVGMAKELLTGSDVAVGTVVGFPHGNSSSEVKIFETLQALKEGATEIDMVINIGKALSGDWEYVEKEIRAITYVTQNNNAIVKVIFENDFLPDDNSKIMLCQICNGIKVDFVKTSTGFGFVKLADGNYNYKGATEHDVALMRKQCNPEIQVKAAGGIRTLKDLLRMQELGAARIGASATEAIVKEFLES